MDCLYKILNIPDDVINVCALDLHDGDLDSLNNSILIINKFHSYFHFEQSFLYLIAAYINYLIGYEDAKKLYLEKAIFQDHNNIQALEFEMLKDDLDQLLVYNKHYKYERDFLSFALGDFNKTKDLILLDEFISSGEKNSECNYQSHRLYFAKSMKYLLSNKLDNALLEIYKSVKMLENSHQSYHKLASDIYAKRSDMFKSMGQVELAGNDMVKSRDFVAI
jgi:hypothetical protein